MPAVEWQADVPDAGHTVDAYRWRSDAEVSELLNRTRPHWPRDSSGNQLSPRMLATIALLSLPLASVVLEHSAGQRRMWTNSVSHSLLELNDLPLVDPDEVAAALRRLDLTVGDLLPPDGRAAGIGTVPTPLGRFIVVSTMNLTVLIADPSVNPLVVWPDPVPGSPWHRVREDRRFVGIVPLDLAWRGRFLRLAESDLPPVAAALAVFELVPAEAMVQLTDPQTGRAATVAATNRWADAVGRPGDDRYGAEFEPTDWSSTASFAALTQSLAGDPGLGDSAGVFTGESDTDSGWAAGSWVRNIVMTGLSTTWILPMPPVSPARSGRPAELASWVGTAIVNVEITASGAGVVSGANEAALASGLMPVDGSEQARRFWSRIFEIVGDSSAMSAATVRIDTADGPMAIYLNRTGARRIEVAWISIRRRDGRAVSLGGHETAGAVLRPDGTVLSASASLARLTGLPPAELIGQRLSAALPTGLGDVANELITEAGLGRQGDRLVVQSTGEELNWAYWTASWVGNDSSGPVEQVEFEAVSLGPIRDESNSLLTRDGVTGLYNRDALNAMLRADPPDRYDGVAYLDIYDFRSINDTYGARAGDTCLRTIAEWLATLARPNDLVVRPSGDEFVVLAGQILTLAEATERLGWPAVVHDGTSIPIRLRMGWSARADHDSLAATARAADLALTAAKHHVSGSVLRHSSQMADTMSRRASQERVLRDSLDSVDGFAVVFQPIVDVRVNQPVGYEALLRTKTATSLGPSDLIEAAERLGLASRLFDAALETAMARAPEVIGADTSLWLNLSRAQLADDLAVSAFITALSRHRIPNDRVVVEVTERVVDEPTGQVAWALDTLRSKGIRFAVDDFGQGASNLAALQTFNVDIVKLDLSLLPRHPDDPRWRLVAAVRSMLSSLDLEVAAEGVETIDQSRRLLELGINLQQGFLFGRPEVGEKIPT